MQRATTPVEITTPRDDDVIVGPGRWRLLAYFALISLVAFAFVGTTLHVLITREVQKTHERAATAHAVFVADALMRDRLQPRDVATPITGARYDALRSYVAPRLIVGGVIRLKVWKPDGTVVFADDQRLVGRKFDDEAASLASVLRKGPKSEISSLGEDENVFERPLTTESIATYVPITLGNDPKPVAVVELYQDYAPSLAQARRSQHTFDALLIGGLFLLYALVLPLMYRTGRTLQLQAKKLHSLLSRERNTVRQLEEYDRLKDEFITATSHELRTPLTVVRGITTMLFSRNDLTPAMTRDLLGRLDGNAEKLERLLVNLLDLDRIKRDSLETKPERVNVAPIVKQAAKSIDLKGHPLKFDVQAVTAKVDRVLFERIVVNLVANAVRHTPDGTPITVRLRAEGKMAALSVEDKGPGVPDDVKDVIFEPFERGNAGGHCPGTGIGLAIVAQFARIHGGRAWVEDREGGGATFRVDVPKTAARTPRAAAARSRASVGTVSRAS